LSFCLSKKAEENFGGLAGFVFSSRGRRNFAGVLIGKGGPEGFLGATTLVGALFLALEEGRAWVFFFETFFLEEDFVAFLDLDFFAMKFQT
jgi:hypothetical protein